MAKTTKKQNQPRGRRTIYEGTVVSDKMDKTITVEVDNYTRHSRYGKFLHRSSSFKVHDEKNEAGVGDKVRIFETRPLSKTKRWKLAQILEKAEATIEVEV